MEKIVTAGMKDCSIDLDGTECVVKFSAPYKVFNLQNNSDNDVIISIYSGKTKTDDGVRIVPAGESRIYAVMHNVDTVYITGEGNIELAAQNEVVNPFKSSVKGGDPDSILTVTKNGNPIIMKNLQDDVPFNEVVVSGKNITPYPFSSGTITNRGLTLTDNGDGSITIIGTPTAGGDVYYISNHFNLLKGDYIIKNRGASAEVGLRIYGYLDGVATLIVYVYGEDEKTFEIDKKYDYYTFVIRIGTISDFMPCVIYPQLELGSTATDYIPPITGREMILTVTGKNVIQYPYYEGPSKSDHGIDFVVNNEGKISVSGQLSDGTYAAYYLKPRNTWYHLPVGKYTVVGGKSATRFIQLNGSKADGSAYTLARDIGEGADFEITDQRGVGINLFIMDNEPVVNEIFEPMIIYRGCDKKYEKYSGQTEYVITPDSNPYVIPMDIIQIDGTNVISADNDAVISVNANRKSKQLEMLMRQEINMLYEGTATEDVPAIVDMSRFKQYHISAMYMDANYNYLAETTISADELEIILESKNPVNIAMSSVSVINLYFAGEKDAIIFYGKASGTSQQYRFEIFGTD